MRLRMSRALQRAWSVLGVPSLSYSPKSLGLNSRSLLPLQPYPAHVANRVSRWETD